jgi:hypothetical protein
MSQFSVLYGEVGNLTPSTGVARDKLFTNLAQQYINQRRRWSWLQASTSVALVAGTRTYKLLGTSPVVTDFDSPISVTLEITAGGARRELRRCSPQMFEDLTGHVSTNAEPIVWTIQGDLAATTSATVLQGGQQSLVLGPPPVATAGHGVNIIIRYWRSAATVSMSADTDLPIIPVQYEDMLIARACAIAMRQYGMMAESQAYQRDFEEMLQAAMDTDQAIYAGDNLEIVYKQGPQTPDQVPITQATYNPASRPLPSAV